MFCQNGDLTNLLKSTRKKVTVWVMQHFQWCFPKNVGFPFWPWWLEAHKTSGQIENIPFCLHLMSCWMRVLSSEDCAVELSLEDPAQCAVSWGLPLWSILDPSTGCFASASLIFPSTWHAVHTHYEYTTTQSPVTAVLKSSLLKPGTSALFSDGLSKF